MVQGLNVAFQIYGGHEWKMANPLARNRLEFIEASLIRRVFSWSLGKRQAIAQPRIRNPLDAFSVHIPMEHRLIPTGRACGTCHEALRDQAGKPQRRRLSQSRKFGDVTLVNQQSMRQVVELAMKRHMANP